MKRTSSKTTSAEQCSANLEEVSNDAVVCHVEDWCLGILVNCHDHFTILHASQVLNCTRDADRYVQLLHHNNNYNYQLLQQLKLPVQQ